MPHLEDEILDPVAAEEIRQAVDGEWCDRVEGAPRK
jgi:hypothetical protein